MSVIQQILTHKIVAVVRLDDYGRAVEVAQALVAGGITVLEFTLTGKGAIEAIAATRKALGDAACVGVQHFDNIAQVIEPRGARESSGCPMSNPTERRSPTCGSAT